MPRPCSHICCSEIWLLLAMRACTWTRWRSPSADVHVQRHRRPAARSRARPCPGLRRAGQRRRCRARRSRRAGRPTGVSRPKASHWCAGSCCGVAGVPCALEVVGRGAQDHVEVAQPARDPVRIGEPADADRDVDARVDQVDHRVVHQQAQAQLRRLGQQRRQRGREVVGEADRRRHAQLAGGRVARLLQRLRRRARRLQHALAVRVVALAGLGQRELARRAVQQRHAAVLLQRADRLADGRRAHAQAARGGAHRAGVDHLGEHGQRLQVIHRFVSCSFKVMAISSRLPPRL